MKQHSNHLFKISTQPISGKRINYKVYSSKQTKVKYNVIEYKLKVATCYRNVGGCTQTSISNICMRNKPMECVRFSKINEMMKLKYLTDRKDKKQGLSISVRTMRIFSFRRTFVQLSTLN